MRFKPLLFILLLGPGCELLTLFDRTPPVCSIRSPADSAIVTGIVQVTAEAFDSSGVATIEFYADGVMFARESSDRATVEWDTRQLAESSWHELFCIATDIAGNRGASDTVNVRVQIIAQRNVFHGQITITNNRYREIKFRANAQEKLIGEARSATSGVITQFLLLDEVNYNNYRRNQSYTALYEKSNVRELSISYQFSADGFYYLIFFNNTGTSQTYWGRFVRE